MLADAAKSGDKRQTLEALRNDLARKIEADDGRYTAALAKQLADVLKELDGMKVPEESAVDQLKAQRDKRRATTTPDGTAKKVVGGTGSGRARGKRGPRS